MVYEVNRFTLNQCLLYRYNLSDIKFKLESLNKPRFLRYATLKKSCPEASKNLDIQQFKTLNSNSMISHFILYKRTLFNDFLVLFIQKNMMVSTMINVNKL